MCGCSRNGKCVTCSKRMNQLSKKPPEGRNAFMFACAIVTPFTTSLVSKRSSAKRTKSQPGDSTTCCEDTAYVRLQKNIRRAAVPSTSDCKNPPPATRVYKYGGFRYASHRNGRDKGRPGRATHVRLKRSGVAGSLQLHRELCRNVTFETSVCTGRT